MFLYLWNFLRGYVIINVRGFSAERFINLLAQKGVYVFDIKPMGVYVSMKIGVRGFDKVNYCARKTRCRYKIVEKRGLPFILNKYKKRNILKFGLLFFVISLYVLSSFVWTLEITGNERIKTDEIVAACKDIGLSPGKFKFKIDTKKVSNSLIRRFDEISWIGVNIKGTNASIKIKETIPETEMHDRITPSDIISDKDGVIEKITVDSGAPLVKSGDVVHKGDVLISGELNTYEFTELKSTSYTRSLGEVLARVYINIPENISEVEKIKEYTGNISYNRYLVINNSVLDIIRPNENTNYDTENCYDRQLAIGDFIFPIGIVKEKHREYNYKNITHSEDELQQMCKEKIYEKLKSLSDGEIISETFEFEMVSGVMRSKGEFIMLEKIGVENIRQ